MGVGVDGCVGEWLGGLPGGLVWVCDYLHVRVFGMSDIL